MIPEKLNVGDEIRVISPSRSLSLPWITKEIKEIMVKRLKDLGLKVTFGKNVDIIDEYDSSPIQARVDDLHDAFRDKNVRGIITVIGGYNSIELLPYLDYNLIKENPKILCGYSDITVLLNSVYEKSGLVTYYGPHFVDFGELKNIDYTIEYFKKCLMSENPYEISQSERWSDDLWGNDQKNRKFYDNDGRVVLNEGKATGEIVGGNLCSFQLLQGTEYFPSLKNKILIIEEIGFFSLNWFKRNFTSLILNKNFRGVKGIMIGRFRTESKISIESLKKIVKDNEYLKDIPIVANIDFGHTSPKATFPIGGLCNLSATKKGVKIEIINH